MGFLCFVESLGDRIILEVHYIQAKRTDLHQGTQLLDSSGFSFSLIIIIIISISVVLLQPNIQTLSDGGTQRILEFQILVEPFVRVIWKPLLHTPMQS